MQTAAYYHTPQLVLAHVPWSLVSAVLDNESLVAKIYKSKVTWECPAVSLKEGVYCISQKGGSPD